MQKHLIVPALFSIPMFSQAELIFSEFEISETTLRFRISGTMPAVGPENSKGVIFLANPDLFEWPGIFQASLLFSSNLEFAEFSGEQKLDIPYFSVDPFGADELFIIFQGGLAENEAIDGTLFLRFNAPVFAPQHVSSLEFYWGRDETLSGPAIDGIPLGLQAFSVVEEKEPNLSIVSSTGNSLSMRGEGFVQFSRNLVDWFSLNPQPNKSFFILSTGEFEESIFFRSR